MKQDSRAPLIIAVVGLLLPVLYVGSYLALVTPPISGSAATMLHRMMNSPDGKISNYRAFPSLAAIVFWPLEQIDRQVRPQAWGPVWQSAPPQGF